MARSNQAWGSITQFGLVWSFCHYLPEDLKLLAFVSILPHFDSHDVAGFSASHLHNRRFS
jgi:hypothetical protein